MAGAFLVRTPLPPRPTTCGVVLGAKSDYFFNLAFIRLFSPVPGTVPGYLLQKKWPLHCGRSLADLVSAAMRNQVLGTPFLLRVKVWKCRHFNIYTCVCVLCFLIKYHALSEQPASLLVSVQPPKGTTLPAPSCVPCATVSVRTAQGHHAGLRGVLSPSHSPPLPQTEPGKQLRRSDHVFNCHGWHRAEPWSYTVG